MVAFAQQYVKRQEYAEEITLDLFVKLWLKRKELSQILNPQVYLFVAVKNASLNQLRGITKNSLTSADSEEYTSLSSPDNSGSGLERKELALQLNQAVEALPVQRKIIFKLIKENGLKAKEVAQILNISTRTVENQMYKAVKTLADTLTPYLGYNPQKHNRRMMFFIFF